MSRVVDSESCGRQGVVWHTGSRVADRESCGRQGVVCCSGVTVPRIGRHSRGPAQSERKNSVICGNVV